MVALSEAVPLPPGRLARLEQVRRPAGVPRPEPFLHLHAPAELVLFHDGQGRLHCEGQERAFGPGSVVHVPPLTAHDFSFAPGPLAWTLLQFDPLLAASLGLAWPDGAFVVDLPEPVRRRAVTLLDWIGEGLADGTGSAALTIRLHALLACVVEAGPAVLPPAAAAPFGRIRPLLLRLHADPAAAPRLAAAATLCAMSPAYFSRRFKALVGSGYAEYVESLRLRQAARWLATGDAPVSVVAARAGYRSHAHFSARFRALFGCAPSRHRPAA